MFNFEEIVMKSFFTSFDFVGVQVVLFFAIMLLVSLASKIRSLKKKSIKTRDIFELLSTDERAIALTYYRVLKIRSIIPILVS